MSELNDLLERFRRGPELVAVAATGASNVELNFKPSPGAWSLRQIVCHLSDSEMVGAYRFRSVIAEDNPSLPAYDQNAWADRLDYNSRKISSALENFRRVRLENYELLRGLPDDAFSRRGVHSQRGPVTLLDLLRIYAEHAEGHARQMLAVREKFKAAKTKASS
jgi:hypothetical protein